MGDGGEEFILLLPETELDGASQRKGESLGSCIARADTALYHGKERGRNRVMIGSYNGLTLVS